MRNFIQTGAALTIAAPAAVLSGAGVQVGDLFGVAAGDAALGFDVVIETTGVFELAKTDEQAWTLGAKIYWDDAAGECTTDADLNTAGDAQNLLIGHAVEAVAVTAGLVLGKVRLSI